MHIVATSRTINLAGMINQKIDGTLHEVEKKRFPDGEMYVRINGSLYQKEVTVVGNTNNEEELLELQFILDAVKEQKPSGITVLVPYFGYARQHMVYKPGEAISARVIMNQISEGIQKIVTVNIHDTYSFKFTNTECEDLHVSGDIAKKHKNNSIELVMAPDDGAYKLAKEVGEVLGCNSSFMNKKRIDSTTVQYDMDHVDAKGLNVLLVDDIISTGGTILRSSEIIRKSGASKIFVSAVHGLFINSSDVKINEVCHGLSVTNTLTSRYNTIDISESLGAYLRR